MDFLCFYFPLFCIHWLMGNYLLPTDSSRYADNIRTDPMGIQPITEMGKQLDKVVDEILDGTLLWSYAILCWLLCSATV